MQIDTNTVISMTDANQNFSKVARMVDQYGRAVIFKNNSPKYLVLDFTIADNTEIVSDREILTSANKIMDKYDGTFKELAK